MANSFWSNVTISVESARATGVTITGISKASTAIVTSTADPSISGGETVLITANGMTQMDGRVVTAANPAGTYTWEASNVDSTDYSTFTDGTLYVLTLGTTIARTTDITVSGGSPNYEEFAYIQDNVNRRTPTSYSPFTLEMECAWDPSDTALTTLKTAAETFEQKGIKVAFSGGQYILAYGYVGCTLIPTGTARGLVKTSLTFDCDGFITAYAS